jgi:hypothetical protein
LNRILDEQKVMERANMVEFAEVVVLKGEDVGLSP